VPEGEVIRTEPSVGTAVSPESDVRVYVSLGKNPVQVPQLSNMSEAAAKEAIEARGLVYGTTSQANSPTIAKGIVIESDPAGGSAMREDGTTIREGDTVNL